MAAVQPRPTRVRTPHFPKAPAPPPNPSLHLYGPLLAFDLGNPFKQRNAHVTLQEPAAMDRLFVDSGRGSPGTLADPPRSSLPSGGGRPFVSLHPAEPTPPSGTSDQDLLENIIMDSCFHTRQRIPDDLLPLAMVMLFDLQDRKFELLKRPAEKGEEPLQDVRDLESCFRRSKTKLAASLARCRVKQDLVSVSCVLPDPVRANQNRAKLLPFYAWVNPLTSSMDQVCVELQAGPGLCEVERMQDLQGGPRFCRDPLCADTLCFPPQLHALMEQSPLTAGHVLNMQHRVVCVAVSALRPHLSDLADVLVAGSFSACTVAHIAVHAAARSGTVLLCGDDLTPGRRDEMQDVLARMDVSNVRVLPGAFLALDEWDSAALRLKLILLLPQCSSSALSDPVHTLITEHGDVEVLQDLSQGPVSQRKLDSLVHHQEKLLGHALTFPKVQTVLYCTRSVYQQENEHLVMRALNKADTPPKLVPFRPATPLLPQTPGSGTTDSRFFKIEPSRHTDGCFIARLTRESDATKVEKAQDVLARAAAKGLLGAMFGDQSQPSRRYTYTLTPEYTYTLTPEYTYTLTPEYTYTLTPEYTYTLTPEYTYTLTPEYTYTLTPEYTYTLTPEYTYTLTPEYTYTLTPEYTYTLTPEYTYTLTPEYTYTLRVGT
ncbi:unnamed protein product [Lota lota]